ncbi:MAG: hypothetical protein ACI8P0_000030 [Planctomycetaceae bacterium]|jgi:hypothetical protein
MTTVSEPELSALHARQRHLELRAIEAAVHLRVTRRDVTELEDRAKTNLLSAVDSARLDEWLEREMSLRRPARESRNGRACGIAGPPAMAGRAFSAELGRVL